jgi:hypothetical protein
VHQTEAFVKGIKEEKCTGQLERVVPPLAEYNLQGRFSFCHVSVQYIALCTMFMAHGANRIVGTSLASLSSATSTATLVEQQQVKQERRFDI